MLHYYNTVKALFFQGKIAEKLSFIHVNVCLFSTLILCYNQAMTDLNNMILQKSSGENRLNPDEQRYYMGTFRERVILVISFDDACEPSFLEKFPTICQTYSQKYQPLILKISPKLSDSLQISLMKIAQENGLTVSIIDEKIATSPFALLLHTDHAVNLENIELADKISLAAEQAKSGEKVPFWKRLFSK